MNHFTLVIYLRTLIIIIRDVINMTSGLIFRLIYHGRSQILPPITSFILTESATTLARKIRQRETPMTALLAQFGCNSGPKRNSRVSLGSGSANIHSVTSEEVVSTFILRIKSVNSFLNAVVDERFDAALKDAQDADSFLQTASSEEIENLSEEQPFFGVPFTIKENFQVKGLRQTVGLSARRNHVSTEDSDAVLAMKSSGAIPLGVTNLSELCTWWESRNNVYGQTNNPYNTTRVAGGSSGGEGSIIAAAGSVMGIGSDIGGSIRMPAFFNGIFGHKPTPGFVSNVGQLPEALGEMKDFLSTGPLCRYATDLVPIFRILAGSQASTILRLAEPVDIKSLKMFYMEDDGGCPLISNVSKELRTTQKKVIEYFRMMHGIETRRVCYPEMKRSLEIWAGKMCNSGGSTFCEEMVQKKGKLNIYAEFMRWCFGQSEHTMPAIALGFLEKLDTISTKADRQEIRDVCRRLKMAFDSTLQDNGVLFYPSFPTTAPYHYQPLCTPFDFAYPAIFNILGLPVTQCPLGLSAQNGMPLGIQVVSTAGNDRLCLRVALELEQAFGGWIPPSNIDKEGSLPKS